MGKAEKIGKELSPEELANLQTEISSALERLKDLEPKIKEIAESKALPADKKEERLKQYEEMYKNHQEKRKDLEHILEKLNS